MSRRLKYKLLLVLAVAAISIWRFYPPQERIKLGLDLKGGIHMVLQVLTNQAVSAELDQMAERVERDLRDKNVPFDTARREGTSILIAQVEPDSEREVRDYLDSSGITIAYNLERISEAGGITFRLSLKQTELRQIQDTTVRQALEVIRKRVDEMGLREPVIQLYGGRAGSIPDQIIVELPGVDDPARVKDIIRSTAQLELKLVHPQQQGVFPSREEALKAIDGRLTEYEVLPYLGGRGESSGWIVVRRAASITGRDLKNARQTFGQFNQPEVSFFLKPDGARTFARVTETNVGKRLAIVLDKKVYSAPTIRSRIEDSGVIEGIGSLAEAQDLALILRTGALPASLAIREERIVGPSLGLDSIKQGVTASIVGFVLVATTMLVYYRLSGVNALLALFLNLIIVLGVLGHFGATLTLPGIAGIILTVGMAVDANILIFERIKEELRLGKTIRSSIEAGFQKAFSAILDSNVTTLIAAFFLYGFGTGPIRGFAVTLTAGLVANLFTAIFVSRAVFEFVLSTRRIERLSI